MSLRCSLTGHDWGETEVEMESDERDGEIAVTEREFQVCERCGERRVLSENTEVRALGEEAEEAPEHADEFTTEETDDAAIIEGKIDRSTPSSDETEVETDPEGKFREEDDADADADETEEEDVKERVREATGTEVTRTENETPNETDADYVCPDCGFTASGGSFRSGDICPDCGGYIEET